MFFALAFFDFFMPGFNTERANSATMHTSIAPTVAVENGSNAKPTITTMLRTHFATSQLCLAKPHEVRTPYSTAVAIRNGIHGTMNCERNASIATGASRPASPSAAPSLRVRTNRTANPPSQTDAAKKMNKINGSFYRSTCFRKLHDHRSSPPTRLSSVAPVQRHSHS